jgi:hypothetical protein
VICLTILPTVSCTSQKEWYCIKPAGPCFETKKQCTGPEWEIEQLDCFPVKEVYCTLKPQPDPMEWPTCYISESSCEIMTETRCKLRD